jgi:SulP family sulfate permease
MSGSAFAIGVLGLLEALAIAKAIAHKSGQSLDYNRQCLAEGVGNLVGSFFRCMPGSGSLSRTAINFQAGARTSLSGVIAAALVAIVVLTLGPLTAYIPAAALAGLLFVAAARLIDLERWRYVLRGSRYDGLLMSVTALAALIIGIEFAILVGVILSVFWYVTRAARLKVTELVISTERVVRERVSSDPPGSEVLIFDFEGELFFAAAPELARHLASAAERAKQHQIKYLVLRLKRVRNPDVVALEVLERFLRDAKTSGLTVLLAGIRSEMMDAIRRVGVFQYLDAGLIFVEDDDAYSATLKAICKARAMRAASDMATETIPPENVAYYVI